MRRFPPEIRPNSIPSRPRVLRHPRRVLAAVAAACLAARLLARAVPPGFADQARSLAAAAKLDPAARRVATAPRRFNRDYFVFLESARRALPPGVRGVALYLPGVDESAFYLAVYEFAPLPVRWNPARPDPGWIAAIYGPARPAGGTVVRELPGGVLLAPPAPGPGDSSH